jgi:3-oxoacyl-[acyl-carrier protein] reductase
LNQLALESELNALGIKAKGYQSNAADFNEAQTMVDAVLLSLVPSIF